MKKFRDPRQGAAKTARILGRALPFLLVGAVFAALLFFPREEGAEGSARSVVSVWNVDTFEGGKGSRTAFLAQAARRAEREQGEVYYYVTSYSAEGFRAAVGRGERPDVLSFGVGLGDITSLCVPLGLSFAGGDTAAGALAYPWCAGGYSLFSLDGNFDAEGETALSQGGSNLPAVAAALGGVTGVEMGSEEAYVGFLSGKYRYLLGTQRDRCRFAARGIEVCERPLDGYCDLYQYVALLSADKRKEGMALIEALLSDEVQGELGQIGMRSASAEQGKWTVSVFTPPDTLREIAERARKESDRNFPENYLKKV